MALALRLRPVARGNLLRLLPNLAPLSTSPDPRELLRIERILDYNPAPGAAQPREPLQQHSRSATVASGSLQTLLLSAGLTTSESASLIRRLPATLINHRRLGRLLEELAGLRIPGGEIKAVLASDPEGLLAMDLGEPSRLLELLARLRCRREAVKDRVLARGALRAAVAARRRVELLHARGLTRREALGVLAAEPRAMLYPLEDVDRKVEFLVNAMGFEVAWLVQYPEFLGVNLDTRIIPRHDVVEHLRSIGGLGDPVEMKHYVRFSRHRFYNMFVKPYPECETIFARERRRDETTVRRRRHPSVGLWKLFTPVKHEKTKEDVENMKLVVKSLR